MYFYPRKGLFGGLPGNGVVVSPPSPIVEQLKKHGTISAAVENMMSAMSVAMSLMQLPLGNGGCASTIAFATWHRKFGSVINHQRLSSFGVSLVLSLFLRFGTDLSEIRTFAYTRLRPNFDVSRGAGGHQRS